MLDLTDNLVPNFIRILRGDSENLPELTCGNSPTIVLVEKVKCYLQFLIGEQISFADRRTDKLFTLKRNNTFVFDVAALILIHFFDDLHKLLLILNYIK